MDMFYQGDGNNTDPNPLPTTPRSSLSYEEVVKELIHDVKQHQRDLHMIIRVFREELARVVKDPRDLDKIFPHIFDIYEVTVTLLGTLEDVIEMSQEQAPPCVGSCFEELAEGAEFEIYEKYAEDITSPMAKDALQNLLSQQDVSAQLINLVFYRHFHKKTSLIRRANCYRLVMVFVKQSNIIYRNCCLAPFGMHVATSSP